MGVAFGALAGGGGMAALSGACMLALGIGLQNFPEGSAVSLPLRREGMSRGRAFFIGQLSGFVEPLSAVLGALLAATLRQALPFLLCFAAGAMLWVILTEMVPESQASSARVPAAWWTILGFCLMTILDVGPGVGRCSRSGTGPLWNFVYFQSSIFFIFGLKKSVILQETADNFQN